MNSTDGNIVDMDFTSNTHDHHGGMDMDHGQCQMNMLFSWDANNLCIIFRQWRVTDYSSLIISMLAVIVLSSGYELVREMTRRYEMRTMDIKGDPPSESSSLVPPERNVKGSKRVHMTKAFLYAVQVFYSFFIMLLFMTYNGWIMLSVATGAFVGYLIWGNSVAARSVACH